jgi:multidrug resistance efflux pump
MRQIVPYVGIAAALGGMLALAGCSNNSTHAAPKPSPGKQTASNVLLACSGRVEGRSDTVEIGAAADGLIERIYVQEGQFVRKGEKLAEIGCPDLHAGLSEALAQAESTRQVRARLVRGARDEERHMAAERTKAARSVLQRAAVNLDRMKVLFAKNDVSRSSVDDAQRDFDVAQAGLNEAQRHEELVNAPPVTEDLAKADADVNTVDERVRVIRSRLSKCTVEAPMNGTILRVLLRPGESFSTITPRPLFRIADLSGRRVRAEVDERDALGAHVGQKAIVFAEGREGQKFAGSVVQIAKSMGRKSILSGDPAEKTDHDVLEAIIGLDGKASALPVGMRVIVQFLSQ